MEFDKVILIGGTNLLYQIADAAVRLKLADEIEVYECNQNGMRGKENKKICYRSAESKQALMDMLKEEEAQALVLSVMNPYIIPKTVVEKKNLFVMNLHHALLPRHRGRNAECWAIYEEDAVAGITWHRVNAGVDTGEIYLQKEVPITETMTSLKLLTQLNKAALEGFLELFETGLAKITPKKQKSSTDDVLHLSKDIPNNGWLDLSWPAKKQSCFLRAMDYGILNVMGKARVRTTDGVFQWKSYRITDAGEEWQKTGGIVNENNTLRIEKDGMIIILNQIEKIGE